MRTSLSALESGATSLIAGMTTVANARAMSSIGNVGSAAGWSPTWIDLPAAAADVITGILGRKADDVANNRIRILRYNSSWVGYIHGTAAYAKIWNTYNNTGTSVLVSVDGGAETGLALPSATGEITLFSGLADEPHLVSVRPNVNMGSAVYFPTASGDILRADGATPRFRTALNVYNPGAAGVRHTANLIVDGSGYSDCLPAYNFKIPGVPCMALDGNIGELFVANKSGGEVYASFDKGSIQTIPINSDGGYIEVPSGTSRTWIWGKEIVSTPSNWLSVGTDVAITFPSLPRLYQWGHSIVLGNNAGGPALTDIYKTAIRNDYIFDVSGVSGEQVGGLNTRLATELTRLTVESGDVAMIDIGRNDNAPVAMSAGDQTDYDAIIDKCVAAGFSKILCMGVMELAGEDYSSFNSDIQTIVNARAENYVYYVDRLAYNDGTVETVDGTHPSATGYAQMDVLNQTYLDLYL